MELGIWQGGALSSANAGGQWIIGWHWSAVVLLVTIGFMWWMGSRWRGRSASEGGSTSSAATPAGITQCSESLYKLCEPKAPLEVEIVFLHGLQMYNYKDAYWTTWIGGKKGKEVFWPQKWLGEDLPGARIWSLSYDASALRTSTTGRMDMFVLGESLVQHLVDFGSIGQGNCPVVFVCHSLGGLVVKGIVYQAHVKFQKDPKYVKFLENLRGFHFYGTPHDGSKLADLFAHIPFAGKMVRILEVINDELGRLNSEFERIEAENFAEKWKFAVVAETHKTSTPTGYSVKVVDESSARHGYNAFLSVPADHYGVCRPESKISGSYKKLLNLIKDAMPVAQHLTLITDEDRQEMSDIL